MKLIKLKYKVDFHPIAYYSFRILSEDIGDCICNILGAGHDESSALANFESNCHSFFSDIFNILNMSDEIEFEFIKEQ